MTRLFDLLEDHFDAVAERSFGTAGGWVSRRLSSLFALLGDLARESAFPHLA